MPNYSDELAARIKRSLLRADFGITALRYAYTDNKQGMRFKGYYSGKSIPTDVREDENNTLCYHVFRQDEYGIEEPVGTLYLKPDGSLDRAEKANITSREKTREEVQEEFLRYIKGMVDYWDKVQAPTREKLDGLAFSILVALDGEDSMLPSFAVIPMPHPEEKAYRMKRGDNYYPRNNPETIKCDIAGNLHEKFRQ